MAIDGKDIVPLPSDRAALIERAEEVCTGREYIHLSLLDEAVRGWDDVQAGRLESVAELKAKYGRDNSGPGS